ncbi:EAL domain-containing protein [Acetobacter sacchari]|uniref:EAL domain-containing protein n=1 Tax=Acetobacter sacchari TaxID=2661687 RepID=A0ABS3LWV8_9PROT|nr:EAL domain-containing protein [Acetobacter sacchari]MBO1360389.1 EAL domain-containing protein [Acetobacter sacchari]
MANADMNSFIHPKETEHLIADRFNRRHAMVANGSLSAAAPHAGSVRPNASSRWRDGERLQTMLDTLPVAVMTVDVVNFSVTYANRLAEHSLATIFNAPAVDPGGLVGAGLDILYRDPEWHKALFADEANLPHSERIRIGFEVIEMRATALEDAAGRYIGPMLMWFLATREVAAEESILLLAHYDSLTGLPNRATFFERIEERLAAPEPKFALLYLDLDGFKFVNDSYGHVAGDDLLKLVAERLIAEAGRRDAVVARLGGDEFALIIDDTHHESLIAFARALIETLSAPYRLSSGVVVQIGASVGLAIAPDHGSAADILIAHSDIALYNAKAAGRRTVKIFTDAMAECLLERVRLENDLREALDARSGMFVFYQPITNVESGQVVAREALVRWHHAQRGWVSPGEFIPVAEQCGLIHQLGEFVLLEACKTAQTWPNKETVAVNVSARQLGQGTLLPVLERVLAHSGLENHRLELEVTETALLSEEVDCVTELRAVRAMGVRVALDDFGTGFSSLSHLRSFPFDKIKIDGSFVREAAHRPESAAIVNMIARLGHTLGVTTVAEGVETQQHLQQVRDVGCVEVQGYFLGRPAPEEADANAVANLSCGALALELRLPDQIEGPALNIL